MAGRIDRSTWLRTVALIAAALALSCSFLVDFDPEDKPCGADGTCREGYFCTKTRRCVRLDAGTGDAGPTSDAAVEEDAGEQLPDAGEEIT